MRNGPEFKALKIKLKSRTAASRVTDDAEYQPAQSSGAKSAIYARLEHDELSYHLSTQFRRDVIDDLIAEGCTREQAEGRTRDQARLFHEAARLGVM